VKLAPACYDCLGRLIRQAAELATDDVSLKQRAISQATKTLDDEFSYDQLSLGIAARIHRIVRDVTLNPDPYRAMKEREMTLARELYPEVSLRSERSNLHSDDLQGCLQLAAAANAIDFFRDPSLIKRDIRRPVDFVVDDSEQFKTKLKNSTNFDLPLVKSMQQFTQVIYVVKPSPVQNDLTMEDVRKSGLEGRFGKVMDTGVASPGIVLSLASARFKREFESADLIFAKGMGHYEALSELPARGRFFHCLMAKCQPVADSLRVPLNSYVAMLQ
jgi:uncharacterized protein with ATP-grasp and redox domains